MWLQNVHLFVVLGWIMKSLGKISACSAWLDKCFSGIWAWCVDSIVDELGSFTSIGFSDGSLVWNIFLVGSGLGVWLPLWMSWGVLH